MDAGAISYIWALTLSATLIDSECDVYSGAVFHR
jgi:hypothetical protein